MAAQVDPLFKMHNAPLWPEYIAMQKSHDECFLDSFIFKLAKEFNVDFKETKRVADITERLAEHEFGTASTVVKYAAAIEYVKRMAGPAPGLKKDGLDMISDFYDANYNIDNDSISRSFFDLLAYVVRRDHHNRDCIRNLVEQAVMDSSANVPWVMRAYNTPQEGNLGAGMASRTHHPARMN